MRTGLPRSRNQLRPDREGTSCQAVLFRLYPEGHGDSGKETENSDDQLCISLALLVTAGDLVVLKEKVLQIVY